VLDGLIYRASREAAALGHTWIGAEHYLLAILAMKVESAAVAALAHLGVRHDEFASDLATAIAASEPPINDASIEAEDVTLNPAAHEFLGRAEGIAVGLGAPAVTLEHVLLAYLWDTSHSYGSLESFGLTPQAVLEELERRGVAVPTASLPPPPRPRTRVFVPFDAADEIWTRPAAQLGPGHQPSRGITPRVGSRSPGRRLGIARSTHLEGTRNQRGQRLRGKTDPQNLSRIRRTRPPASQADSGIRAFERERRRTPATMRGRDLSAARIRAGESSMFWDVWALSGCQTGGVRT
jgi:hypothetical protein